MKVDAVPTQQRPFSMHGISEEAYKKIVQDWIDAGFIERPTKMGIEWSSCGFPVPKKIRHFSMEGDCGLARSKFTESKMQLPIKNN